MSQSRDARVWLLCQVITGLPLPPVYDAKVALKRAFLDESARRPPRETQLTPCQPWERPSGKSRFARA